MPPHEQEPMQAPSSPVPCPSSIDESFSAIVYSEEDSILKIPEDQFPPKLNFRAGCAIICMDQKLGSSVPKVTYGTVLYAAVDLRSRTRAYVYKIQPTRRPSGEAYFVRESSLHFAQATPVWVKFSNGYEEAYIFGSTQKSHKATPVYSVTKVEDQGLYNDISGLRVKYRTSGSSKPTDDEMEILSMLSEQQETEQATVSKDKSTWTGFTCSDMCT